MFKQKLKTRSRRTPSEGGSASNYSYYANRSRPEMATGRQKEANDESKGSKWWYHIPSVLAGLAVIVSFVYVLSLNTDPKVLLFTDKDSQYLVHDISVYQKAAQAIMKKSIFNRTKWTVDTIGLANSLKAQFPELDQVSVTIPLSGHRPIFELQPSQPALILVSGSESYVVDQKGRVMVRSSDVPKKSNLSVPSVTDKGGLALAIGKIALPSSTVNFITVITGQFGAKQLTVNSIELPTIANELHVRIAGQPYFIKFNLEGEPRAEAGTYLAALQRFQADKTSPSEYVDVRIDERVYYK